MNVRRFLSCIANIIIIYNYNDYSLLFTFDAHDNWLDGHRDKVSCLTGLSVSLF